MTIRHLPTKNLWECRVFIAGQRKSFYARTSEEAQAKAEAELALERDAASIVSSSTLGGFIAVEVAPLYAGKAAKTIEQAEWAFGHIIDGLGHLKPEQLTASTLTRFLRRFEKDHQYWTVVAVRKHLYRTTRLLARYGRIPFNLMEEVDVQIKPITRGVPTPAEAMSLFLANEHDVAGPLVFLCFVLGLRRNEAAALTVEHFDGQTLHIPGTKNTSADRTILLSRGIASTIEGFAKRTARYLAPNEDGGRIVHATSRLMENACSRAHTERYHWHALRHAFGAIEVECGAPRAVRLAILGQSTRAVQDLYQHATPDICREWLAKWERFLGLVPQTSTPEVGYSVGYGLSK